MYQIGQNVIFGELHRTCATAGSFERAVELYRGALIPDCGDTWVVEERSRCQQGYLTALRALADNAANNGEWQELEHLSRMAINADRLNEDYYRNLMLALARNNKPAEFDEAFRSLSLGLLLEENRQPDSTTTELYQKLSSRQFS